MIHDFSDAFLNISRAHRESKVCYKPLLYLQYILVLVTWIGCRIFILSYCAVYTALKNLYHATVYPDFYEPI